MTPLVLSLVFVLVVIAILLFPEHPKKTIGFLLGMVILLSIFKSANAAMSIKNVGYMEYRYPRIVVVEKAQNGYVWRCPAEGATTYWRNAQLDIPSACAQDRIFADAFEVKP